MNHSLGRLSYGRWYCDDYYGWVWVRRYMGACMSKWCNNDAYVGWAPLPPCRSICMLEFVFHRMTCTCTLLEFHLLSGFGGAVRYRDFVPERNVGVIFAVEILDNLGRWRSRHQSRLDRGSSNSAAGMRQPFRCSEVLATKQNTSAATTD